MLLKTLITTAVFSVVLSVSQASATHDSIYSPCGTEYGFIHMTYEEWAAHITTMEANGTIPPGVVHRYWEANHTTGKGTNIQEDGTIPAWDQWARGLTDGQILSIADWANGNYPEIEQLNFDAGLVPEWVLDANQQVRRFNDPFWSQPNPMSPSFTVWQSLCMADYGYSIPVMEINADGVWESNIPTITTAQSACRVQLDQAVASLIAEGSIASTHVTVNDHGVFLLHTSPIPLVETGVVTEWALGHDGYGRHYMDTYWEHMFADVSNWSFWGINCTETDLTGSTSGSESNQEATPSTTTQAIVAPTTSEQTLATTTTLATFASIPNAETPVTTTTQAVEGPTPTTEAPDPSPPSLQASSNTLPAGYDLFTAQYEGWPFERTLRLLEIRYPQGTPNKYHFRLSYAVDFLQAGGMVGQLDTVWNSG